MKIFCQIFIFILILLPEISFAYFCAYNSSARGLRDTVLLEYKNNKYIHLHDSNVTISISNSRDYPYIVFIREIMFKGYLTQEDESNYFDVTMNNLKLFYHKKNWLGNNCTTTFYESADDSSMIDHEKKPVILREEEKAIILRLAESCIRSVVCEVDPFNVDRDGDLSFESVQSTINYYVDTAIAAILGIFLNEDRVLEISLKGTPIYEKWHTSIKLHDILVLGIDEIQRTDDVYIANDNDDNVYTVEFGFRLPTLSIALINIEYSSLATILQDIFLPIVSLSLQAKTNGENSATIDINGFSFNATVAIDLESANCSVKLIDFNIVSYKNIELYLELGRAIPLFLKADPTTFETLQNAAIISVNQLVSKQMLDCQQYLNKLPDLLKNLL